MPYLAKAAVEDMLQKTDHEGGRWHVIPANSKKFARVAVIETVNAAIEARLDQLGRKVPKARN